MSSFENAVETAIYTALANNTTLTALLAGGTASPSIYQAVAPENADPPYVVFQAQSPSTPIWRLTNMLCENALYQCRAVVEGRSAALAGTIANLIVDTIGGTAPLTITGYETMLCRREQNIAFPETAPGGQVYQHRGAIFRIQAYPS